MSVDRSNKDLTRAVELHPEVLQSRPKLPDTLWLRVVHFQNVQASRKDVRTIGGQNDALDSRVLLNLIQLNVEGREELQV